jgi:hypothetical protein
MKEAKTNEADPEVVEEKYSDVKEFWIGFRSGKYSICRCFKTGFQHTYVLTKSGDNWVELNPRNHALEVFVLPFPIGSNVPELLVRDHGHRFLYVKVKQKRRSNPSYNIFRTIQCVNVVKYMLGIKLFCFTPYQLYKRLLRLEDFERRRKGILELKII